MERTLFEERFLSAAAHAREFAQTFVKESLPPTLLFHVYLNSSYDGHAGSEDRLFPSDSSRMVHLERLSTQQVIDELWRDGFVPQWVDLSVVGETGVATLIEVLACGRFASDELSLYHKEKGYPPFHVLSPALPAMRVDAERFSIYNRATCWTIADLERVQLHMNEVWSLQLCGSTFDDALLDALRPVFPAVEIIELHQTRIGGRGLRWLRECPRLRVLRLDCGGMQCLDMTGLPQIPRLESLTIEEVGDQLLGVPDIGATCSALQNLTLSLERDISTDGELEVHELARLSLTAPSLPTWLKVRGLTSVDVHCVHATTAAVCAMLAEMTETLTSVGLCGTPVTDEVFLLLARLPHLRYLDLVDTEVTNAALSGFIRSRPELKYFPRIATG